MKTRLTPMALAVLLALSTVVPGPAPAQEDDRRVTAQQLQARLMAFADTYMSAFSEEYARLSAEGLTPKQRVYLHTRLTLSASSAVTIASGPDVTQNLLDMVAMVTLSRMIADEKWIDEELAIDTTNIRAIAARFEKRIWDIAADVATDAQLATMRGFIEEHRRRNPDQRAAYYVRFDEAAEMRGESSLTKDVREGGLLSSVSEAGQAVDEMRDTAERALFIGNRMPILVSWRVENLLYKLALSPEFKELRRTPDELNASIDALSASIEAIPGLVTSEREAVLAALDESEGALTGTVGELRGALTEAIAVLPEVEALAASAERTVASGEKTSVALASMLATSERLLDRIQRDGERFDRYAALVPELGATAARLENLMGSVDGILGADFSVQSLVDRVFWRIVMLIVIFFAVMAAAGVLYKVAVQRWAPPAPG